MNALLHTKEIVIVMLSLLIFLLFISLSRYPLTQQVVVFNKGLAVTQFAKSLTGRDVNDKEQKRLVEYFIKTMGQALSEYQHEHRCLIISSKEVLAGGEDITSALLPVIAHKMKPLINHLKEARNEHR